MLTRVHVDPGGESQRPIGFWRLHRGVSDKGTFLSPLRQFSNPKDSIHSTFVTSDIRRMKKNEKRITKSPTIAYKSPFFAESNCLGSPPENIIRIPEKIIRKSAIIPAKTKSQ